VTTALLDLNILTALLWPAHEHHDAAHAWFGTRGRARWATCPVTQLGFVRLTSNAAFSREALSPRDAVALLDVNLQHPAHEFWSEQVSVPAAMKGLEVRSRGHRQVTDVYLLSLAGRHRGVLATFDRGLYAFAVDTFAAALELVPTN